MFAYTINSTHISLSLHTINFRLAFALKMPGLDWMLEEQTHRYDFFLLTIYRLWCWWWWSWCMLHTHKIWFYLSPKWEFCSSKKEKKIMINIFIAFSTISLIFLQCLHYFWGRFVAEREKKNKVCVCVCQPKEM